MTIIDAHPNYITAPICIPNPIYTPLPLAATAAAFVVPCAEQRVPGGEAGINWSGDSTKILDKASTEEYQTKPQHAKQSPYTLNKAPAAAY